MRRQGTAALLFSLAAAAARAEEPEPPAKPEVKEVIVVTASRTGQHVHDAPAAVSVLTADDLARTPTDSYAGLLRTIPGLNVAQLSARDAQVNTRGATNSLATGQLVLLDGRSLYLDFFGFVMWDFLPVDVSEIRQIEAVRGPGSAIWGANAMSGVINLITKRPAEMRGTSVTLGGGDHSTVLANVTHAASHDRFSWKVSAGYMRQGPFDRPSGLIPGTSTPYPPFRNEGTEQPKLDVRADYDLSDASYVSVSAGYAGTDGLVHSGLGPFNVERGASMKYAKADWIRGALRATAFANFLDVDSTNLLAIGLDGKPIGFAFKTNTYNIDATNTAVLGERHIVTYGATARHNDFDLSIARAGREREEYGVFAQDELLFRNGRLVAGARWDSVEPIGSVVSPRLALLVSPVRDHTVRLSFSRAFRAPSLINNSLDTAIISPIDLPTGRYVFPTNAVGNPTLGEEELDAYELGYVGGVGTRVVVAASVYRNTIRGATDFYASSFYDAAHPPPRWPLPVAFLDAPPLRNALPATFTYRNIGKIVNSGVEVALNGRASPAWSWFANASWQADSKVSGIPENEINAAPARRANAGVAWDRGRGFIHGNMNYQSESIWRDVLDARYWGPTGSFTSVNVAGGVRLSSRITLSVTATNLLDERIQQHVFGDIISRRVSAKMVWRD